jgi:hypothetical protein
MAAAAPTSSTSSKSSSAASSSRAATGGRALRAHDYARDKPEIQRSKAPGDRCCYPGKPTSRGYCPLRRLVVDGVVIRDRHGSVGCTTEKVRTFLDHFPLDCVRSNLQSANVYAWIHVPNLAIEGRGLAKKK